MEGGDSWRLQSDWYSPTRLHDSPVEYYFPGDRFIPNRSLMDLDQARGMLTNRSTNQHSKPKFRIEGYQRTLQNLTLDTEGRPFQMMVFRGSPKSIKNNSSHTTHSSEEMQCTSKTPRKIPKSACRILDAPLMSRDYYLNIMDWGKANILVVALGRCVYLWNADTHLAELLSEERGNEYPCSVAWSQDGKSIAVGYSCSKIQLFDRETLRPLRCFTDGHHKRVVSVAWNGHSLTSGSRDRIINQDVRARNSIGCNIKPHRGEVCGLKWSATGRYLATGANDHRVYIWDASKMRSKQDYTLCFDEHCAAVKALAWCPFDHNVIASGGGTEDGCIKVWNLKNGRCISNFDSRSQICGLQWNRHHKEIMSAHGYGHEDYRNRLCLLKYPSMSCIWESPKQRGRVLYLSQSPDGLSVVSAVEDATIRFWEVFGPPAIADCRSSNSSLESLLSLTATPLR